MSRQSPEKKQLKDLLVEYKLDRPVPHDIREYFSNEMGPIFKKVIKRAGIIGTIYGIFLSIYFYFKKFGITVTVTKIIITFVSFVSLIVGGYLLYDYLSNAGADARYHTPGIVAKNTTVKPAVENFSFIMGIDQFTSSTVDAATLDSAARSISKGLDEIMGPHFSRYLARPGQEGTYTLMGNIEKVENTYIVFIKVVDMKSSSILYAGKERAVSRDELEKACDRISRNVSTRIK
jgi:hypothetical protein